MSVCFASSLVRRLGRWRAVGLSWGQGGGGGRMASVCAPEQCLRQRARLNLWGAMLDDGTCVTLAAFENRAASPTPDLTSRTAPRRPHVTGRRAHRRARHRAPTGRDRDQGPFVSMWIEDRIEVTCCNRFVTDSRSFPDTTADRQPEKTANFASHDSAMSLPAADRWRADGERGGRRAAWDLPRARSARPLHQPASYSSHRSR